MYSSVVIDAWTLMVLVYLFMNSNQEPGINTRQVITLINGIKLCKETLVKGKYRIFQGSNHVPCTIPSFCGLNSR